MFGLRSVWRAAYVLPMLAVAAGCVTTAYVPTGETYPAKAYDCDIEVFSAAPPERAYREIGILEGAGSFWKADLEDVIPKLREEACLVGGDALILVSANKYAWADVDGMDREELYAFATVVRWEAGGGGR